VAVEKYNARDCTFQISDGAPTTPAWVEIGGLTKFAPKRGENEETADTTTFASGGQYEQEVMQRGSSLDIEGFRLLDPTTGTGDPGQALVEALAAQVGNASLGQIRFKAPGDTNWEMWTCTASIGDEGGENNDKSAWAATFTRSGAADSAAVTP
jgi:hypothetical protein